MPVTPTGTLSLPLHYLRTQVADSAAFRTWVGAADQAAALARVHPIQADGDATLPFAIVDWAEGLSLKSVAGGTRTHFELDGRLALCFRASISSLHDAVDASYAFLNTLGAVLDDLCELAGTPGYLDITEITLESGPSRPEEDEARTAGDFYQAVFLVSYRSKGG